MKVRPMSKVVVTARRTQSRRTAARTAGRADRHGRRLFGAEGFTEVGAERIAREAERDCGALYHQFDDKADLFAAVLDQVEAEIARRVADSVAGFDPDDSTGMLVAGAPPPGSTPAANRICSASSCSTVPSILGWDRWREICLRHTVGLIAALLQDGVDHDSLPASPSRP